METREMDILLMPDCIQLENTNLTFEKSLPADMAVKAQGFKMQFQEETNIVPT